MTTQRVKALDFRTLAQVADWLAVGVAVSLPWSISASAILTTLWLLVGLLTLDISMVRRELAAFAGGLPVLLWILAAVAMLWVDVTWFERIDGLGGFYRYKPFHRCWRHSAVRCTFALYGFLVQVPFHTKTGHF